jgi:hypothetical protein
MRIKHTLLIFIILLTQLCCVLADSGPRHLYLTWQGDTSTTMTVVFQTLEPVSDPTVYYGTTSSSKLDAYEHSLRGRPTRFPGLKRWVHFVQLTGLKPGETYYFKAGSPKIGYSNERKFRTLSNESKPLRFVTGGDMWIEPATFQLMRQAASQSPEFALIGGDIAYADGSVEYLNFWEKWLDAWDEFMVTPDGYMIPMVLAIGNHETVGGFDGTPEDAPFYYNFFKQDEKAYFSRQFGPNVMVYVLDSGHTNPIGGAQAAWLAQEMKRTAQIPYRFALYHVPCYPSYPGSFSGPQAVAGRKHWVPLFDRYKLTGAFENHYHTFKRTKPLKNNKVDPAGTVYFGDGCWGRPPRKVRDERAWYEAEASSRRHVWLVDVQEDSVLYRAMDPHGKVFHTYSSPGGVD